MWLRGLPLVFLAAAAGTPMYAQKDTQLAWTMYSTYTDPVTGAAVTSGITSDIAGAYVAGKGKSSVMTVIQGATNDAVLTVSGTRWFNVSVGKQSSGNVPRNFLGSDFSTPFPANVSLKGTLLMMPLTKCSADCVFFTTLSSDFTGSDGITYHVPMLNVADALQQGLKGYDGCPYYNASVRVEYHQANFNHNGYTKNTWIATPMLQTVASYSNPNPPSLDTINPNCTSVMFPFLGPLPNFTGTSAAIAVAVQDQMGQIFNFGQYHVPFYFKLEQQ